MPKQLIIDETKNIEERAKALGVPYVSLAGKTIPAEILKEISEEAASFYQLVPIEKKGNTLRVGMINPDDLKAKQALNFIAKRRNFEPEICIITPADFKNILIQYRTLKEEVAVALKELQEELIEAAPETKKSKAEEVAERVMAEAPITKIVAVMLRHAQEGRASDIHIEPSETEVRIRFRVDGILYTSIILPKNIHSAVASRVKILSNLKIDETRVPQDGRFHSVIDGKKIDFRVSTFPTSFGEKVVLRLLDPTVGLLNFEQLGLTGYNLRVVQEGIKRPFGMILITGPTGSGKTTTLYAILNVLNEAGVNIVSLEDPIEYNIEGISQSQIKPEIGYTFASGLRSILRQDPDIIMVGEIRDEETADLATHSALTGHIVLSTLHTNNAIGVIPRLVDMGVSGFLLPSAVIIAMAQRLVRRLCSDCKREADISPKVRELIEKEIAGMPEQTKKDYQELLSRGIKIYESPGCKVCAGKGTKGRIAIYEALYMTPQLERIIIEAPTESKILEESRRQGMLTMRQDGFLKVLEGLISLEEVLEAVEESQ
jgi:type IV pilus assembly protein PilB